MSARKPDLNHVFTMLQKAIDADKVYKASSSSSSSAPPPSLLDAYSAAISALRAVLLLPLEHEASQLLTVELSSFESRLSFLRSVGLASLPLAVATLVVDDDAAHLEDLLQEVAPFASSAPVYVHVAQPPVPAPSPPAPPGSRASDLERRSQEELEHWIKGGGAAAGERERSAPSSSSSSPFREREREASGLLAAALSRDERAGPDARQDEAAKVVEAYLKAAEQYSELVRDLKSSPSFAERDGMLKTASGRLSGLLDRVEHLKQSTLAPPSAPLPKAPAATKTRPAASAASLHAPTAPPPAASSPYSYTAEELEVLKNSSLASFGSKIFMPFLDSDVTQSNFTTFGNAPFVDPDGPLALSPSMSKVFYKFARPSEIASANRLVPLPVTMYHELSPYSIKQALVTDCSFVASLCIASAYERKYNKSIVTCSIYPQGRAGKPLVNDNGKYIVKLWMNGCARKVVIDDLLPVDRNMRIICSHTKCETHLEIWVSLIEKAYMKLCGGMSYAFPGSNSGIDLFSLTGWIPERIFFSSLGGGDRGGGRRGAPSIKDHETPPERVYQRLLSAASFGDCLITASVSADIGDKAAEAVGLVTAHAYAVLRVCEVKGAGGGRFVMMKNPWASQCWKGRYSAGDQQAWTAKLCRELGYDAAAARKSDDGIFWISWEDFVLYFQCIFLNWNPELFSYRFTTHRMWPVSLGPVSDQYCCEDNPQYTLTASEEAIKKKATVFILVSRHVDLLEMQGKESDDYLTCHLYKKAGNGRQVYPGENCIQKGIYTSNPHVLLRHEVDSPETAALSLVLSQFQKKHDVMFSLSIFSTETFTFSKAPDTLTHKVSVTSKWTDTTAGGSCGRSRLFHTNPQYSITLLRDCRLEIMLKAAPTFSVNCSVVPAKGRRRVEGIGRDEDVLSTGDYRSGVAHCAGRIKAGEYIAILSTWNAGEVGPYIFEVRSDEEVGKGKAVVIYEIPDESKMYPFNYSLDGQWEGSTAAGCGNFGRYLQNVTFSFSAQKECTLFGRLQVVGYVNSDSDNRLPLNASVFALTEGGRVAPNASPVGKDCGLVATTNDGVYSSSLTGAALPHFKIAPGRAYGVVLSTFEPTAARFKLTIFSSESLDIVRVV